MRRGVHALCLRRAQNTQGPAELVGAAQGFGAVGEICGGAVGGVVGLAAGVEEDVAVVFVEVVVFASLSITLGNRFGGN